MAKLQAARTRLAHIAAPSQLTAQHKLMLSGADKMIAALNDLHGLRNDNDGRHLISKVNRAGEHFAGLQHQSYSTVTSTATSTPDQAPLERPLRNMQRPFGVALSGTLEAGTGSHSQSASDPATASDRSKL